METFEQRERPALEVPWGARQVWLSGLMSIGLLVAAVIVGTVVVVLWTRAELPEVSTTVVFQLVFALEALLLIPPWLMGPHKYHLPWSVLGFRRVSFGKGALVAIVGLGLVLLANLAWTAIMSWLKLELVEQPDPLPYFGGGLRGLITALFLGAVVAPIAEEALFRGYVYPGLKHSWGMAWGLVASSAIFAALHGFSAVIPPIFAIGIVLALSYELTRSIWPAIAIHAGMNALAFISAYMTSISGQGLGF